MLWTIAVILLVLWLLGYPVYHVGGNLIHILLVVALVVVIVRLVQGRKVL
jgi:putative effector of murein hydrolase